MPEDKTTDYLAQEYLFLQKTIEEFDGRALTIKAWSVTFSAAGLGLAYQQHNPILLLVAAGSALVFWIIEAVWKFHQRAFYPRIFAIEARFAEQAGDPAVAPFQISSRWETELSAGSAGPRLQQSGRSSTSLAVPFFLGVMLPHILVLAAGLLLYRYAPPV